MVLQYFGFHLSYTNHLFYITINVNFKSNSCNIFLLGSYGGFFFFCTVYWSQIMIEMPCYLLKCKYRQSKCIKEQGLTINFNEKNEKSAFGLFIFLHFSHLTKTWIPTSSTPNSSSDLDLQRACFYWACLWSPPREFYQIYFLLGF